MCKKKKKKKKKFFLGIEKKNKKTQPNCRFKSHSGDPSPATFKAVEAGSVRPQPDKHKESLVQ